VHLPCSSTLFHRHSILVSRRLPITEDNLRNSCGVGADIVIERLLSSYPYLYATPEYCSKSYAVKGTQERIAVEANALIDIAGTDNFGRHRLFLSSHC